MAPSGVRSSRRLMGAFPPLGIKALIRPSGAARGGEVSSRLPKRAGGLSAHLSKAIDTMGNGGVV